MQVGLPKGHLKENIIRILSESGITFTFKNVCVIYDLGLNPVRLMVAVHESQKGILDYPPERPLIIATEYESLAARWAFEKGLSHITVQTHGSTEAYAPEHADIIFDCVETGVTMKANNLVIVDEILDSTTHLVANKFSLRNRYLSEQIEEVVEKIRRSNH